MIKERRKKKIKNCGINIGSFFKSVDIYGEKVTLTYKGEDSFKTYPGALITVLIIGTVLAYGIFRTHIWLNKMNPDVSKKSFLRDLNVAENYRPQDLGFDFAFSPNRELDPTVFQLTASFVNFYYSTE